MSRPATHGRSVLGPRTFLAFISGVIIGLGFVAPVIPKTAGAALVAFIQSDGVVIAVGVLALALLMVLMAILYQGYLRT